MLGAAFCSPTPRDVIQSVWKLRTRNLDFYKAFPGKFEDGSENFESHWLNLKELFSNGYKSRILKSLNLSGETEILEQE